MEKWEILIKMVLKHEGGFCDIKGDSGGSTYCGIAKNSHSNWKGWEVLKKYMPLKYNQIVNDSYLNSLVYDVYKKDYYIPMKIDMIDDLMISAHIFCHGVNAGNRAAIKLLQKSINIVYGANIMVDGIIGTNTLKYVNSDKIIELGQEFISQRNIFYRNIVKNKPSQKKFLNGWLNRVTGTTNTILNMEEKPIQNILYADVKKENDNVITSISKGIISFIKGKFS